MSAERMTTREEASHLKAVITRCVDDLERSGYARGQVGAAMIGIAAALIAVNDGFDQASSAINAVRNALDSNENPVN